MGRATGVVILAAMTLISGGIIWFMLADTAEKVSDDMDFVGPSPSSSGSFLHTGDTAVPVEDIRLFVQSPQGPLEVPTTALFSQVGSSFDPDEEICVVGCVVPAAGVIAASLSVEGYEGNATLLVDYPSVEVPAVDLPGAL